MTSRTITPCIWSNHLGTEAATLYVNSFPKTRLIQDTPVMKVLDMDGEPLAILNGGPKFAPNHSISFFIVLEDIPAIEHAWQQLSVGGQVLMPLETYPWSPRYGWIQDRFGVNWQLFLGQRESMNGYRIPSLMFTGIQAGKAETAIKFYTSVFPDAYIVDISRYEPGEPDTTGTVKHGRFLLMGQPFNAHDSALGPGVPFTEGISFILSCDTQEEIDFYWEKLTEGGEAQMCGWLKDRFGVSWQVVPSILPALMANPETAKRVTDAFLRMTKFDIAKLLSA